MGDSMDITEFKSRLELRAIIGIFLTILTLLIAFTPLSIWLFEVFNINSLISVIFIVFICIILPSTISASLVYSSAFKENINLYKVVYIADVFMLIWGIIAIILWFMVLPCGGSIL